MKVDVNNVLTAIVIGLLTWMGTTLQSLDTSMQLVKYKVEVMQDQSFYKDCAYCNHKLHSELK